MSKSTYAFVRMMLKANVFTSIKPAMLLNDTPEVLITCFDPNRFPDKWDHYRTLGGICRCCVPIAEPGGALVIPAHSPLAATPTGHRVDEVFFYKLDMAVKKLGAKKIRPVVHYPCLAAKEARLRNLRVLELNVEAKDRLRQRYPGCDIALLVHVDWHGYSQPSESPMNTYKFDRPAFDIWKQSDSGKIYQAAA